MLKLASESVPKTNNSESWKEAEDMIMDCLTRQHLPTVFKKFNKSGDGALSSSEWLVGVRTHLPRCNALSDQLINKVFTNIDVGVGEDHLGMQLCNRHVCD